MYVCICNAVTESDVHEAVRDGVDNMRELISRTGCSSTCGRCAKTAVEALDEALGSNPRFLRVVSGGRAA